MMGRKSCRWVVRAVATCCGCPLFAVAGFSLLSLGELLVFIVGPHRRRYALAIVTCPSLLGACHREVVVSMVGRGVNDENELRFCRSSLPRRTCKASHLRYGRGVHHAIVVVVAVVVVVAIFFSIATCCSGCLDFFVCLRQERWEKTGHDICRGLFP